MTGFNNLNSADVPHVHFFEQIKLRVQKVSIELDDQSLTYAEASYYVQKIALKLLASRGKSPIENGVVYQFMERSIEMPLGMFAIFATGGIYTALNPDDSDGRLSTIIDETVIQSSAQVRKMLYLQEVSDILMKMFRN